VKVFWLIKFVDGLEEDKVVKELKAWVKERQRVSWLFMEDSRRF
jgi:hypothetical protein